MPEFEDPKPTVTISQKEYESLIEDSNWRGAVEAAGVDNWSGMEYAWKIMNGEDPFD